MEQSVFSSSQVIIWFFAFFKADVYMQNLSCRQNFKNGGFCFWFQLLRGHLEKSRSDHVMCAHLQVLAALRFYGNGDQDDGRLSDRVTIPPERLHHAIKEVSEVPGAI